MSGNAGDQTTTPTLAWWNFVGHARRAARAAAAWTKREMPNQYREASFRSRQLYQNTIGRLRPVQTWTVGRVHKVIDAQEARAEKRVNAAAAKKVKVDFTTAADNPPRINRQTTTAVPRQANGQEGRAAGDLAKVSISGLPTRTSAPAPPRNPAPQAPTRKR